jgi:transcriptional regulator with XRE-family HTH domain
LNDRRPTAMELWGRELALARESVGMSQEALASKIYVSKSSVAMWETGQRCPKSQDLRSAENALGTNGYLDRLLVDWVTRELPPKWVGKWRSAEQRTTSLLSFQPLIVPDLLQIEAYSRAVLEAGRYRSDAVEGLVGEQADRQTILTRDDTPIFVGLLTESVLTNNVGGAKIMHEQLMYIADMSQGRNVVVQVVPSSAEVCAGFSGAYTIANFDNGNDVAYVDNQLTGEVVEGSAGVAILRKFFEIFRGEALSKKDSTELILKVARERWIPDS